MRQRVAQPRRITRRTEAVDAREKLAHIFEEMKTRAAKLGAAVDFRDLERDYREKIDAMIEGGYTLAARAELGNVKLAGNAMLMRALGDAA